MADDDVVIITQPVFEPGQFSMLTITGNSGEAILRVQNTRAGKGEDLWKDFTRAIRDILQASPDVVAALRNRGFEVKILGEKL